MTLRPLWHPAWNDSVNHLLEVMSMPTVSLGIIPLMTERTAVSSAGFWIFDRSLAALATPTASVEVTERR